MIITLSFVIGILILLVVYLEIDRRNWKQSAEHYLHVLNHPNKSDKEAIADGWSRGLAWGIDWPDPRDRS